MRHHCNRCDLNEFAAPEWLPSAEHVQLAARQLTAASQPLQGPLSSAQSCVPLRMRATTIGISHLRSRSFMGPHSAYHSVRCWRLRRRIRDALHLFACPVFDSTARSALRILEEGEVDSLHGQGQASRLPAQVAAQRPSAFTKGAAPSTSRAAGSVTSATCKPEFRRNLTPTKPAVQISDTDRKRKILITNA